MMDDLTEKIEAIGDHVSSVHVFIFTVYAFIKNFRSFWLIVEYFIRFSYDAFVS